MPLGAHKAWHRAAVLSLCLLIVIAVFDRFITFLHPLMGSDLRWFLPRLLDTHHFMLLNGVQIHWWTPSFGGGLPDFAHPESMQFSIPQALVFVLPPSRAVEVSYWIVTGAGFGGCHLLLRSVFALRFAPSVFGALLFSLNGFVMHHAAAGHLSYHAYPLLPLCLLLILTGRPRSPMVVTSQATAAGVLLAYVVYSGGYYLPVLWSASAVMVLALHGLLVGRRFPLRRVVVKSGLALTVAFALAAPKLHAAAAFMSNFPRLYGIQSLAHDKTWLELLGFQFFGGSQVRIVSTNPDAVGFADALVRIAREMDYNCGLWEYDCSMALAVVPLLLCASVVVVHSLYTRLDAEPRDLAVCLSFLIPLGLVIWVMHDLMVLRGLLSPTLENLPGPSRLSLRIRLTASFILPLATVAAIGMNGLWHRYRHPAVRGVFVGVLCLLWVPFVAAYWGIADSSYYRDDLVRDTSGVDALWRARQDDPRAIPPITHVIDVPDSAWSQYCDREYLMGLAGSTTLRPDEPLFGYGLELFETPLEVGAARQVRDGAFNMHYPPAFLERPPGGRFIFERIPDDDAANLELFLAHRVPRWPLSGDQRLLIRVSKATAVGCLMIWLFAAVIVVSRRRWVA